MHIAWPWIGFIVGALGVSAGCLLPPRWLPPLLPNDKLLHFLAFGGLSLLAGQIATNEIKLAWWLAGLFIAGWLIEVVQKWVPGRDFCWRDLAANTAGIVLAGYSLLLLDAYA